MKRRRAVSEIISAIIVISVVVAGLGVYTNLSGQRILGDTLTVKEAMDEKDDQISELIEFVDMFTSTVDSNIFEIYLHNYGLKDITISKVYVNGIINMDDVPTNSISVQDLNRIDIFPNSKVIPVDKTSGLILDFNDNSGPNPATISSVVILTDSNKIIEIINDG